MSHFQAGSWALGFENEPLLAENGSASSSICFPHTRAGGDATSDPHSPRPAPRDLRASPPCTACTPAGAGLGRSTGAGATQDSKGMDHKSGCGSGEGGRAARDGAALPYSSDNPGRPGAGCCDADTVGAWVRATRLLSCRSLDPISTFARGRKVQSLAARSQQGE